MSFRGSLLPAQSREPSGLLALPLAGLFPGFALPACERLINPFGSAVYPKRTQLSVTAPLRMARGTAFNLSGVVRGRIPDEGLVEYQGIQPSIQTFSLAGQRNERGAAFRLDHGNAGQARADQTEFAEFVKGLAKGAGIAQVAPRNDDPVGELPV